jgi:hypothetical protein
VTAAPDVNLEGALTDFFWSRCVLSRLFFRMSIPPVKSGLQNSATILCALDDIWTGEAEKDQSG